MFFVHQVMRWIQNVFPFATENYIMSCTFSCGGRSDFKFTHQEWSLNEDDIRFAKMLSLAQRSRSQWGLGKSQGTYLSSSSCRRLFYSWTIMYQIKYHIVSFAEVNTAEKIGSILGMGKLASSVNWSCSSLVKRNLRALAHVRNAIEACLMPKVFVICWMGVKAAISIPIHHAIHGSRGLEKIEQRNDVVQGYFLKPPYKR